MTWAAQFWAEFVAAKSMTPKTTTTISSITQKSDQRGRPRAG